MGKFVGDSVGETDGNPVVGLDVVGLADGETVGALNVGIAVGTRVGTDNVGESVGLDDVGILDGLAVGKLSVGDEVGVEVGTAVGNDVGCDDGIMVGKDVGAHVLPQHVSPHNSEISFIPGPTSQQRSLTDEHMVN